MPSPSVDPRPLAVTACGRVWYLERENMERLWDNMADFATDDERPPYWAELWPSSLVLASWLQTQTALIRGRTCLDIGCGIGFTALVGQWLGARVIGMDHESRALAFARRNAVRNGIGQPQWVAMDWRRPALAAGSIDVAWGGDIMYERRFADPLADFLRHVLRPGGVAFVAEPSRAVYDAFFPAVTGRGLGMRCAHREETAAVVRQERPVPVRVWRIEH
ncbi:MAG: class I SAM-dependent methyltransferase [Deltaproteobacteria bacterium]|nr:class I SAM-dependent methyltransferase [Deltaproteobacteria bacterium]